MADLSKVYLNPNETNQTRQNSVTRQLLETVSNIKQFNVCDFGAIGDAATDNTKAFKACFAAAKAASAYEISISGDGIFGGYPVYIPHGIYNVSSPIDTGGIGCVYGAGQGTLIRNANPTADTFTRTTDISPIIFRDFGVDGAGSNTGTFINISADSQIKVHRVFFANVTRGVFLQNGSLSSIVDCDFNQSALGIQIQDIAAPDAGDHFITGCSFVGSTTATGILWGSAGGMRVLNNKFLGLAYGINFTTASSNVATGQSEIIGNSFDGITKAGINFNNANAGCSFGNLSVVGNFFACASTGTCINTDAGNYWLAVVDVTGNFLAATAPAPAINLNGTCSNFYFSGNEFEADPVFTISSDSSFHVIGDNNYAGSATIFDNIANAGTVITGIQTGSGAPSFAATRGALYANATAASAATRLYINTSTSSSASNAWAHFTASS